MIYKKLVVVAILISRALAPVRSKAFVHSHERRSFIVDSEGKVNLAILAEAFVVFFRLACLAVQCLRKCVQLKSHNVSDDDMKQEGEMFMMILLQQSRIKKGESQAKMSR